MDLQSLAWRTDLALLEHAGSEVVDRGDHVVVRTPANPSFYWGNWLVLAAPPSAEEVPEWLGVFEQEFPAATHRTFGVDGASGTGEDLAAFAAAGYAVDVSSVMSTGAVHAPPQPEHVR